MVSFMSIGYVVAVTLRIDSASGGGFSSRESGYERIVCYVRIFEMDLLFDV